jgi:hypothetical protein
VRDRGPRAPFVRGVPLDCYCKTTWPGGILCIKKGAAAPDPTLYARVGGPGGSSAATSPKCYGPNLATGGDIANDGTFIQAVGGRVGAAALTDATRQDLAAADRAHDAGRIDAAAAALAKLSALERARVSQRVAAAPLGPARGLPVGPGRARGRYEDGKNVRLDELDGMCRPRLTGDVYCKTEWPGGFIEVEKGAPAPSGPWAPAAVKRGVRTLLDPVTKKPVTIIVSQLVPAGECYPRAGTPWWSRGGAWVARAAHGTAEATAAQLRQAGAGIAARVRAASAASAAQLAASLLPAAGAGPAAPCVTYRKTQWPVGATICVPEGTSVSGPWERVG